MKATLSTLRNLVMSPFAALSLFLQAYVGAVLFFACVILEKYLIITESRYTVDSLLEEISLTLKGKVDYYRHAYENFDFKHFRPNF
jgi:hypothetical protein